MLPPRMWISNLLLWPLLFVGCGKAEQESQDTVRDVRAMKIADFEGVSQRSFPGQASASQEVDLAFRVAGPLITLPVNVGDEVENGEVIARIDPRDFQVALRNAEGTLQRARASQERAQADYDRAIDLQQRSPSAITAQSVDRFREAIEVARADVVTLEATVESAEDALQDTQLKAPFAGTIVATYVENFENVREKQMIARLLDKSRIEFEINLPETLISLVPYVEEIQVTFDAFPELKTSAEVKEIGAEASSTTRTFPVTLVMDQPEGASILPGMAGRATGIARPPGDEESLNIVVPVAAVIAPQPEGKSYVWVIDEASNIVKRREVQVGKLISSGFIIDGGLKRGEMIAVAGAHFLKEGQQVRPVIQ